MTSTHYYIVEAVLQWRSITVNDVPLGEDSNGSIGFCVVFDDPAQAEKFAAGMGRNVRQVTMLTQETDGRQAECSYPDCGCAESRLCNAKSGPNDAAVSLNRPQRKADQ